MISTVTTTTVAAVALESLVGSLALVSILVLLGLLIQKELATALAGIPARHLGRALNIGIVPLVIAFALIVGSKVAEVLLA